MRESRIKIILCLFALLMAASISCTKNVDTVNSQVEEKEVLEGKANSLVIERGLSIEEYLRRQQEKKDSSESIVAESLWDENSNNSFLFIDHKARKVGDIITILIVESSSATKDATTETSRESEIDGKIDRLLGLPSNFGMKNFLNSRQPFSPNVKGDFLNEFTGSGSTTRSGKITATISAVVTSVLPNRNMRILGRSEIKVNEENQIITISGIIRPQDIDETNSVRSTSIAEAQIKYYGVGVVASQQKEGWLAKIFNYIWPF